MAGAHPPAPRVTDVAAVTSDILPTLAALAGRPVPDRPLDGIDLGPLMDGRMTSQSVEPRPVVPDAGREVVAAAPGRRAAGPAIASPSVF